MDAGNYGPEAVATGGSFGKPHNGDGRSNDDDSVSTKTPEEERLEASHKASSLTEPTLSGGTRDTVSAEEISVELGQYDALIEVYDAPPYDLPRLVYLELVLTIADLLDGESEGSLYARDIYRHLSGPARSMLDPRHRSGRDHPGTGSGLPVSGVTSVASIPSILTIHEQKEHDEGKWRSQPTHYRLGEPAITAYCEAHHLSPNFRAVAEAVQSLVEWGEMSAVNALTEAGGPKAEEAAGHGGAEGRHAGPPANDVNSIFDTVLFASPVKPRLSAYIGGFEAEIEAVVPAWAVIATFSVCGNSSEESAEKTDSERQKRRTLDALSEEEIGKLKKREPLDRVPGYKIPPSFREELLEWRPVLGESKPLMAILQLLLSSTRRDDDYAVYDDLTGIPLWHNLLFWSFGYTGRRHAHKDMGVNSGMLLELFRREVDPGFSWTRWDSRVNRARIVDSHSIPQRIIEKSKRLMLSPKDYDDLVEMISGRKTDSHWKSAERKDRFEYIDGNRPVIEPPESTRRIQEYLNSLDQKTFSSSRYGVFSKERLNRAVEAVCKRFKREHDRDQELRKVFWIGHFEQPLYLPCDRFPRLKADRHNQAMNLPSSVLRATYDERDYELDLSKAHLASYVPVARREGLEVPTLKQYLQANLNDNELILEGGDLWRDFAAATDLEDQEAARTAVKKAYSAVYGSGRDNLLHEISQVYARIADDYPDRKTVRPILSHPLMEELLKTRDKLEAIITSRGSLEDATGQFIPLSKWDETKEDEDRWRGVMAYVNCTYEQELMSAAFSAANEERNRGARTRYTIWLYQGDGFTVRMSSKASHSRQIERLQDAVGEKAAELGMPTELEVDYSGGSDMPL